MGIAELVVGVGAGYATTGLALLGPVAGVGATAVVMTGWHVRQIVRDVVNAPGSASWTP